VRIGAMLLCLVSTTVVLSAAVCGADRQIIKAKPLGKIVPDSVMQSIYDKVKTQFKYGIVIKGDDGKLVDSPNVFSHGGKWYMIYVCLNKVGYETHLAVSDDLLHWRTLGKVLEFPQKGWDAWQVDGSITLYDLKWGGSYKLQSYRGKYWMPYIGGAKQGWEPDPLSIGMAWSKDPVSLTGWNRLPEPILTPDQPDARPFEQLTLYKSTVIWDKSKSLGYPFIMYYNGKQKGEWIERIGMAVSKDMVHWERYGEEPVIDNGSGVSGDPQITRICDVWVMFYYGAFWKPKAFNTFACSYDLVHWTKWTGPSLVEPSEPWDMDYAHKTWVVYHNGVVYHFYCAVGNEVRTIAVATSKDMRQP
jgi:predicted GH43/DUF377 family glycosyl hydrolase